jgi:hypothetical protein
MTYFKNDVTEDDLTAEELIKRIYDKPDWVSHVNDRLSYKEYIVPEDEKEYVFSYYSFGLVAIIQRWIQNNCSNDIEKIVNIMKKVIGYEI